MLSAKWIMYLCISHPSLQALRIILEEEERLYGLETMGKYKEVLSY